MSVAKIRKLYNLWFSEASSTSIAAVANAALDDIGFSDAYVAEMLDDARTGMAVDKPKVIKDNVWGMVELDSSALRLLDCPIVQRLRGIRQLGFTYLTYPSAEHTRFAHSLGMYSVVWHLLDAMKPRQDSDTLPDGVLPATLTDAEKTDLLHAAILHDVGHMPFSHVTETILAANRHRTFCGVPTVEDFQFAAEETLGKEVKLSECLSLAIVLAPRFQKFYKEFVRRDEKAEAILRVASLIAGVPSVPSRRGLADVISSTSVDADKIDYINRDATACGISVGIDIARLFLRSQFLRAPRSALVGLLPHDLLPTDETVIFIVNASGIDTIEEIRQARAALYQRVYLHQTTRNAERILGKAMQKIADRGGRPSPVRDALRLWVMDDFQLLRTLRRDTDPEVQFLAQSLTNRRLPKRAMIFGRRFIECAIPLDTVFSTLSREAYYHILKQTMGSCLEELQETKLKGPLVSELEEAIRKNAIDIAQRVRQLDRSVAPISIQPTVLTVLPMPNLERSRIGDCIVLEHGALDYSSRRTKADEQYEAADIFKSLGYILTDRDWREAVFIAAQVVLYNLHAVDHRINLPVGGRNVEVRSFARLLIDPERVCRHVGLSRSRIDNMNELLERKGFYDRMPRLARPLRDNNHNIDRIVAKLASFEGEGGWRVSSELCRAFLNQFPPRYREEIANFIEHVQVLDRTSISTLLSDGMQRIAVRDNPRKFITGFSPNSGNLVRMLLEQERKAELEANGWVICKSIGEALATAARDDLLVMCDDNVSSGSQAECQLRAWMGQRRSTWPEELRGEPGIEESSLTPDERVKFQQIRTVIAVCAGTIKARERLQECCTELRIERPVELMYGREIQTGEKLSDELTKYLKSVGSQLVAGVRYPHGLPKGRVGQRARKECTSDALGYDGMFGNLATLFNVPTSTLTPLWCPGIANGAAWTPLLLRRGYLKYLVVS